MQNSNYNHHTIEKQIYDYWEKNNFFKPKKNKKKKRPDIKTISIPSAINPAPLNLMLDFQNFQIFFFYNIFFIIFFTFT